jgi:hypothetical protein
MIFSESGGIAVRVLVLVRSRYPVPPDQFPAMVEGFVAWRDRYRSIMESFEFFAGSDGGFGVVNAPDEAALNQMMLEFPFGLVSKVDIYPVIDGDVALGQLRQAMQAMAGGAG